MCGGQTSGHSFLSVWATCPLGAGPGLDLSRALASTPTAGCDHTLVQLPRGRVQGPPQHLWLRAQQLDPVSLQCPPACSRVRLPGCSWAHCQLTNAPRGPCSPDALGSSCSWPQRTSAPSRQWPARALADRTLGSGLGQPAGQTRGCGLLRVGCLWGLRGGRGREGDERLRKTEQGRDGQRADRKGDRRASRVRALVGGRGLCRGTLGMPRAAAHRGDFF